MARSQTPEGRAKLAETIIREYDKKRDSNRNIIEDEIRRITCPLGVSDTDSNVEDYKVNDDQFDTTVRQAIVTVRNGIMSRLLPQSSKWFAHAFTSETDEDKANEERHNLALEKLSDLQFKLLGQDNFYTSTSESLNDFLNFGATNIRMRKGKRRFANFTAMERSLYQFLLDDEGFADIVWMYHKLTAYEIQTMFGTGALPQKIKDAIDDDDLDKKFEVIQKVSRRSSFKESNRGKQLSNPEDREYESIWVSKGDKDIIGISKDKRKKVIYYDGLYYNEHTIGRLMSRAGQSGGEGITTMVLPDIRTVNSKKLNIEKMENFGGDPVWYQDETNPIDEVILPGGRINRDPFSPESAPSPVQMPFEGLDQERMGVQLIQNSIKEAFSVHVFKMFTDIDVATNRKTAFEARLIKSEQNSLLFTLLGPFIGEIIKPLLTKHLNLMIRENKVPQSILDDLPENFETNLTSQFARSVETTKAEDLMSAVEIGAQIEQFSPGVVQSTLDLPAAYAEIVRDSLEIDTDHLYTQGERQEKMDEFNARQNAVVESQIANQGADALSKLSG